MKNFLPILATLLTSTYLVPSLCASDLELANGQLDNTSIGSVPSWQMNNAKAFVTDDGKSVVLLPGEFPAKFAKLWQRLAFDGNAYRALRVTIEVRSVDRSDSASMETSSAKPRLRIFFHPAETKWSNKEALWPHQKQGVFQAIDLQPDWHTVSFELQCPEDARNVEIAVETDNPPYAIEVDEISIEPLPRS